MLPPKNALAQLHLFNASSLKLTELQDYSLLYYSCKLKYVVYELCFELYCAMI